MHTFYANASQPFHDAGYPIFLAEIASTVNEVLLTWHLLETEAASDPVARFGLLNRFADGFDGTITSQAMYAEFEKQTHAAVEEGQPLTLELLNDLFGAAVSTYSPGVVVDERVLRVSVRDRPIRGDQYRNCRPRRGRCCPQPLSADAGGGWIGLSDDVAQERGSRSLLRGADPGCLQGVRARGLRNGTA